ncbi:NACHT and WD repeat domain-containing protein 2 [Desmophyllum pertusum]|uniref:NACHT and WD repeat domain-containing protein 2 n=1 Tax=Desmophyllum pertusum TaxID=174260 RepID=A0A9X0CU73_9CNID|nr:NACHT and WD repeat domain-containing protein 2 [Desmophyllum pertusum]
MDWYPRQLPSNVYAILSTLPGEEYQALPSLRTILPEECFMEVPKIPLYEADVILDNWLRQLIKTYVMEAFQKCPLPLYLKLAFDEALRWKSYTPDSDLNLEPTIREIIDDLFDRVERRHGRILVSHALAYITASKNGLTEPELEDLLSLDDDYWTPPVRRLPPLLWIRIRSDIGDYLIERGADGTQVVFWYHRQFIEVARERYLTDEKAMKIHANMSDYFLGTWSGGVKKPFVNKEDKEMSMDRLVPKQPLMFDSREDKEIFNLRKLSELPFHLLHSGNLEQMREECLCNFEFLLAKLRGTSLQVLMGDFSSYLNVKPKDDDVELLHECFQLSAHSLSQDSNQLPTQLIGRMYNFLQRQEQYPDVCKVLKQALNSSTACFLPNRKCLTAPGGALRSAIGFDPVWL